MTEIVLERFFDEGGRYLGKIVVRKKDLTPEYLDILGKDKEDKEGWRKYREKLKEEGYEIMDVMKVER